MEMQPVTSRVLMSDVLKNNVNEAEISDDTSAGFLIAIISVSPEPDRVETMVGSVSSYLLDEHYELEVRFMLEDAFAFTQSWPKLPITGFEIHFVKEVLTVKGPLKVTAVRMQDIDPARQTCVLAMKLCRE